MFKVIFYQTADGRKPAGEYLKSLDETARSQIVQDVALLERLGNMMVGEKSKALEDGLFELRVLDRSNTYRLIYFFVIGEKIIVTNGFTKKTQKTPKNEIELAKKYREDYLSRH